MTEQELEDVIDAAVNDLNLARRLRELATSATPDEYGRRTSVEIGYTDLVALIEAVAARLETV